MRATVVIHHAVTTTNQYNIPARVSETDYTYTGDVVFSNRVDESKTIPEEAASANLITVLVPLSAVVAGGDRVTAKDRSGADIIKRWKVLTVRRHDRRLMLRCIRGEA